MLNKSIAFRLSLYVSIAVIAVFMVFMLFFHAFSSRSISKNISNEAVGLTNNVIREIEKELITTREVGFNVANQICFYAQYNQSELFINGLMERYPFINALHINISKDIAEIECHNLSAFRDSSGVQFKQSNEGHFMYPGEKAVFEELFQQKKPGWTEVIQCKRRDIKVVSFYMPISKTINNEEQIIGEVITELSLKYLNNLLNSINLRERGFALLVDREGRNLTTPKDIFVPSTIYDIPPEVYKEQPDLQKILNEDSSGEAILYVQSRGGEKHWGYHSKVEETGWTILFGIPYSDLFKDLNRSMFVMVVITFLGIITIFIVVRYLINRLVEPLSQATSQLTRFVSLTKGDKIKNTANEVKLVSESLDAIKLWYKKYRIRQSEEIIKNQQQVQDILEAAEIQQSLINTAFSDFTKRDVVDLHGIYKPARIVSGDLFDYFFLDDENLIFTMGDVSGKGVSAAFFMSIAQTILKSNAKYKKASEIVSNANNELYTNNQHQFFLTLFLGILNVKTGVLEYCNAAHTPAYILKHNGGILELSNNHGLPLGLYTEKNYQSSRIKIEKGDSIILYTDGVTELQNENMIQFGHERLIENIKNLIGLEPEKLVGRFYKSLKAFKGTAAQIDDISFMTIKYKGTLKPDE